MSDTLFVALLALILGIWLGVSMCEHWPRERVFSLREGEP